MATVGHDHVHNLVDALSFIWSPIDIIDWHWLRQLTSQQLGISNKVLINEVACSASIDHSFRRSFLHRIHSPQVDWEHDAIPARFEQMNLEPPGHPLLPLGLT